MPFFGPGGLSGYTPSQTESGLDPTLVQALVKQFPGLQSLTGDQGPMTLATLGYQGQGPTLFQGQGTSAFNLSPFEGVSGVTPESITGGLAAGAFGKSSSQQPFSSPSTFQLPSLQLPQAQAAAIQGGYGGGEDLTGGFQTAETSPGFSVSAGDVLGAAKVAGDVGSDLFALGTGTAFDPGQQMQQPAVQQQRAGERADLSTPSLAGVLSGVNPTNPLAPAAPLSNILGFPEGTSFSLPQPGELLAPPAQNLPLAPGTQFEMPGGPTLSAPGGSAAAALGPSGGGLLDILGNLLGGAQALGGLYGTVSGLVEPGKGGPNPTDITNLAMGLPDTINSLSQAVGGGALLPSTQTSLIPQAAIDAVAQVSPSLANMLGSVGPGAAAAIISFLPQLIQMAGANLSPSEQAKAQLAAQVASQVVATAAPMLMGQAAAWPLAAATLPVAVIQGVKEIQEAGDIEQGMARYKSDLAGPVREIQGFLPKDAPNIYNTMTDPSATPQQKLDAYNRALYLQELQNQYDRYWSGAPIELGAGVYAPGQPQIADFLRPYSMMNEASLLMGQDALTQAGQQFRPFWNTQYSGGLPSILGSFLPSVAQKDYYGYSPELLTGMGFQQSPTGQWLDPRGYEGPQGYGIEQGTPLTAPKLAEFGLKNYGAGDWRPGTYEQYAGMLQPGNLMSGLQQIAQQQGAQFSNPFLTLPQEIQRALQSDVVSQQLGGFTQGIQGLTQRAPELVQAAQTSLAGAPALGQPTGGGLDLERLLREMGYLG